MKTMTANAMAFFVIIGSIMALVVKHNKPQYIFMSVSVIISSIIFLLLQNRITTDIRPISHRKLMLLGTAFFLNLTSIILIIHFRIDDYSRPVLSIFLMTFGWVIVFFQILSSRMDRIRIPILLEILVLGITCIYSQSTMFPSLIGVDSWTHRAFVDMIISTAHIPENQPYSGTPLYHLLIISSMLISNISFRYVTYLAIIPAFLLVSSLSLLGITKKTFGNQIALVALLLFFMNSYTIMFALNTIPNTLGFSFLALGILLVLNLKPSLIKKILIIFIFH